MTPQTIRGQKQAEQVSRPDTRAKLPALNGWGHEASTLCPAPINLWAICSKIWWTPAAVLALLSTKSMAFLRMQTS